MVIEAHKKITQHTTINILVSKDLQKAQNF